MSDSHGSEEAARDSGESGSSVSVEDAPSTTTEHDETEASSATHEVEASDADDANDAHDTGDADDAGDTDHGHDAYGTHDTHDDDTSGAGVADEDDEHHVEGGSDRKALYAAVAVAVGAVIAVLVLLAAFVWPDFTGPGKPDDAASQAVSALSSKDSAALDRIGCKRSDGKPSVQLPPQILQLVQSATPSGPPMMTLSSEARQTINLTLGVPGQPPQSAPVDMVLAVNDGSWCLNNIEAGQ